MDKIAVYDRQTGRQFVSSDDYDVIFDCLLAYLGLDQRVYHSADLYLLDEQDWEVYKSATDFVRSLRIEDYVLADELAAYLGIDWLYDLSSAVEYDGCEVSQDTADQHEDELMGLVDIGALLASMGVVLPAMPDDDLNESLEAYRQLRAAGDDVNTSDYI